MDSSQFSDNQPRFEAIEQMETQGATCDTFRVKIYGKLHFLKRLKAEYADDIRYQEALRKEFETGYRLEHPNLVRYLLLDKDGILMEYVDGETLSQRLEKNPDYFKQRKNSDKLVRQLLDVLGCLHSHQVLHLDLKPENILLTHINDDVKLIDLGFCYTDTFADTQGHTNAFAAPEQKTGGEVDVRTDIYAFGKILELLPDHSLYNKVIARCTAERPEDRYQSVGEILYDINHRQRYFRYVAAFVAVGAVLAIGIALLPHKENVSPEVKKVQKDSVVVVAQRDSLVEKKSLDSVIQNDPVRLPQSPKKDTETLFREDMNRMIDKAYRSTIVNFCDSFFPPRVKYPGNPWQDAATEFHNQAIEIGDRLVEKYPTIPESVIRQETEMRFEGLVTYVFNKMRTNDPQ
jgi:serine/threonine-protein kinase